jgi:signal transduction histidine kinase
VRSLQLPPLQNEGAIAMDDYELELAALTHTLDGRQQLVRALLQQLTPEQLDRLSDACDTLAYLIDDHTIRVNDQHKQKTKP